MWLISGSWCYECDTFLQHVTASYPRRLNPQLYSCGSLISLIIFMSFENEVINMLCNVYNVHEGCKEIEIIFKHSSNYCLPELSMRYNTVIKCLNNLIEVSLWSFATKPDNLGFSLMILLQVFTLWDLWSGMESLLSVLISEFSSYSLSIISW